MGRLRVRVQPVKPNVNRVQVVEKVGKNQVVHKHVGTAHNEQELAFLTQLAREFIHAGHTPLEGFDELMAEASGSTPAVTTGESMPASVGVSFGITHRKSFSALLYETLAGVYDRLGFAKALDDVTFEKLVIGRIIEPTSKLDTIRVLDELGLYPPSNSSIHRCLDRAQREEYRNALSACCVAVSGLEMMTLVLYDVTTLYFQIEREDDYRKQGLSKERRLEPQIVVGLLVDRGGFPLAVHSFEGNKAETLTLRPVLDAFVKKNPQVKICVVADAGMLSASNLTALEGAGYSYVVGSRVAKTPYEIAEYVADGSELEDEQIFDTMQTMAGAEGKRVKRRVVYQYRTKRARLDLQNIDKLVRKAEKIIEAGGVPKKNRFLRLDGAASSINETLVESARKRAGIKGYVTNLDEPARFIVDAYHQLFNVEKSFRISKSDLRARPIHHQLREKIDAHLTIVFAALAIARHVEQATGLSIRKFVKTLLPLRTAIIEVAGTEYKAEPEIPASIREILKKLGA